MKIRNGFVSNSSSSSFIVQVEKSLIDDLTDDSKVNPITAENIALLEQYGFTRTSCGHACSWKRPKEEDPELQRFMRYDVSCNEEFVMAFLMKNNISFKASCHYDHYFVLFEKDEDLYVYAHNFGNEIDTYGFKDKDYCEWEQICRTPKIERRLVRELLKDNEIYLKHIEEEK